LKRSGKILLFGLSVLTLLVILVVAGVVRRESVVGGLTVKIDTRGFAPLLSVSEVEMSLTEEFPGLTSRRVKEVSPKRIERFMLANPYVEEAYAAVSVGGRIIVNITTRRPVVRVFHEGRDFYIDSLGHCFSARRSNNCDVVVASGFLGNTLPADVSSISLNLPDTDSNYVGDRMVNVWRIAKFLDRHGDGYSLLFDQIYVDADGDILLQPRLGNHEILVGDANRLEEKFCNLKRFYANGLPHAGYDSYNRISLKYKGQVVCTKRNSNKNK
jgi:cell division protein FtsQ